MLDNNVCSFFALTNTSCKDLVANLPSRFQSYVSVMILVYNAAQLSVAGFQEHAYAVSLDLANNNIKILEFCGQLDPVARRFSKSLSMHYDRFREVHPASHSDTLPPSHFASDQSSEYLSTAPAATAVLYNTSQKLFE